MFCMHVSFLRMFRYVGICVTYATKYMFEYVSAGLIVFQGSKGFEARAMLNVDVEIGA